MVVGPAFKKVTLQFEVSELGILRSPAELIRFYASGCSMTAMLKSLNSLDPDLDGTYDVSLNTTTLGTYYFIFVAIDIAGNIQYIADGESTFKVEIVTITDFIPPTIDSPIDIVYEEGTTGHVITWHPSDAYPHDYTIYHNGTVKESVSWDGSSISVNVDGLAPGTHNYTIVVCDEAGHRTSDTVMVIVTVPPTTTTTEEEGAKDTPGFTLGILFVLGIVLLVTRSIHRRSQKR